MSTFTRCLIARAKACVGTPIDLYPDNRIARLLLRKIPGSRLFSSAQACKVIVICEDARKVQCLKALARMRWKRFPKVILAGTAHMERISRRPVRPVAHDEQSCASGYPACKQHLVDTLDRAKRLGLAGTVVELGTYKGGTLRMLIRTAQDLGIRDKLEFFGFDTWDGKLHRSHFLDLFDMPQWAGTSKSVAHRNVPSATLVKGEIAQTVPKWLAAHTQSIVLVFIDTDNYSPVLQALPSLWKRLAPGGAVVFGHYVSPENFYNTIGEHIAAKEFFEHRSDYLHPIGSGLFVKRSRKKINL